MNDSSRQPIRRTTGLAQAVARYYAEFLSTDFKSARLPKRVTERKNGKGMLVSTDLSRYPGVSERIHKALCGPAFNTITVNIKRGAHRTELPPLVRSVIDGAIAQVDEQQLERLVNVLVEKCSRLVTGGDMDVELFRDVVVERMTDTLSQELVDNLMGNLREHLKNAANRPEEDIISLQRGLAERLVSDFPEKAIDALSSLVVEDDTAQLHEVLSSHLELTSIQHVMRDYFETYIASDLHTELIDMRLSQRMLENSEFFLYVGTLQLDGVIYPLSYQRLELTESSDTYTIETDSRLHLNKQAIDFIVATLCEKAGRELPPSTLSERILDLTDIEGSVMDVLQGVVERVGQACSVRIESPLSSVVGGTVTNAPGFSISSRVAIALADKSDESMLNDYEALLSGIESDTASIEAFEELVNGFLTQNPESVHHQVERYWDELSLSQRLVFESPLPMAEEQRKILLALDLPDTRYVAVEGPPGTGKSHTISAIAFDAILRGKSLLILSDKKEALDVVEDKINATLSKIRHKDNFQNPILRLGRYSGNYNRLLRRSTIESLELSRRMAKPVEEKIKGLRELELSHLQDDIEEASLGLSQIQLQDIAGAIELEQSVLKDFPQLVGMCESEAADIVTDYRACVAYLDGNQARIQQLIQFGPQSVRLLRRLRKVIDLLSQVRLDTKVDLSLIRTMNAQQVPVLREAMQQIDAAKGIMGYLFSGRDMLALSKQLSDEFGISLSKPHLHRETLGNILHVADVLLSGISDRGMDESEFALAYDLLRNGCPPVIPVDVLAGAERLEMALQDEHPLLKGCIEEDLLTALLDGADPVLEPLRRYADLQGRMHHLQEQFLQVPQVDYLGNKTRLEGMYTHELAGVIDDRLLDFYHHRRADAETLGDIIRAKTRFPPERFALLKEAFPCIISGLREYAEYIPLQKGMFDLVIIDEASQVSIAQAMPAIIRAKKMVVLGDRKQYGNVKTALASKAINNSYMDEMMNSLSAPHRDDKYIIKRLERFNIKNSLMDFFDLIANYNIQLRKHFRSYPELISFSSQYFYDGSLQTMKIRSKPLQSIIEFHPVKATPVDLSINANEQEVLHILAQLEDMLDDELTCSVGVITPHSDQVGQFHRQLDIHPRKNEMLNTLKLKVMNFDSCQGEERDVVFYSMVATPEKDRLTHVFPASIATAAEDIEFNLRLQRLNVGFSRAKEKIVIVHSKPIEDFKSSIRVVLAHFRNIADRAGEADREAAGASSLQESRVHEWLNQSATLQALGKAVDIHFGFPINEYLTSLDPSYQHPSFRADVLLSVNTGSRQRHIVIEYDDFEASTLIRKGRQVPTLAMGQYLTEQDIERERVLESFGVKLLRINRFILGANPVAIIDDLLNQLIHDIHEGEDGHSVIERTRALTAQAEEGVENGSRRFCRKCNLLKPLYDFSSESAKSGYGRYCAPCRA